ISLAYTAAACFFVLHALATPGVLLDVPNTGFVVAMPIGLALAAVYAAWSAGEVDAARARSILQHARVQYLVLGVVVAVWAWWSLARIPPLDRVLSTETQDASLLVVAIPGIVLYVIAAIRYLGLARRRGSRLAAAVGATWLLLAEAQLATAFARSWHLSWWEWHVLVLMAFGTIAVVVHQLPDSEPFADLYLDAVAGGVREVSVLFADLVAFSTYSEQHTSDEVQTLVNTYFEAVVPAVRAEGGHVDRYIGDAVMVTWNVAREQSDHAVRAARGALRFQAAAEGVALAHPDWPRFRVGVNTGSATVGLIGGGRERAYTVLGDTVNVAARLEGLPPPGGIAISSATLEYLHDHQVSSLGAVTVKGRTTPVEVWLLESLA
ncbi:MAG: adenylate/guanylate cyclase domain-containing protein, partial [Acidimicrobiia bacterium]|nr:adenylate/guanylate cyclase domain-containing protein [Acidimicrobiia bacterium]